MKLLEDLITEDNDFIEAGTKIQVIDEGILDWLSAIGTGIGAGLKHVGKFVLGLINALSRSGIDQNDMRMISDLEIPLEYEDDIRSEFKAIKDKYIIKDKETRRVIIDLIKMKHLKPEMKENAEKALKEITSKLKLKQDEEETITER